MNRKKRILDTGAFLISAVLVSVLGIYIKADALPPERVIRITAKTSHPVLTQFYPPAPRLPVGMSGYTDSQLFWLIKHGIRNTGMPAWGGMLSDEEIWQIVTLLKNSQDLPSSVEAEWGAPRKKSAQ